MRNYFILKSQTWKILKFPLYCLFQTLKSNKLFHSTTKHNVFMNFQHFGTAVDCVIENNFLQQFRQQKKYRKHEKLFFWIVFWLLLFLFNHKTAQAHTEMHYCVRCFFVLKSPEFHARCQQVVHVTSRRRSTKNPLHFCVMSVGSSAVWKKDQREKPVDHIITNQISFLVSQINQCLTVVKGIQED